jgi:hypothetical protein
MIRTFKRFELDGIILPMGADEPDIDNSIRIVDPDNDAILVACNIEHRAAVLENAGTADVPLDVSRFCPIGLPHLPKPSHHRLAGIGNTRASIQENFDRAERYHPHRRIVT